MLTSNYKSAVLPGARLGTLRRRSARPPGERGPAPGQVLLQPGPDERPAPHAARP
jgi:hypothetical protein